MMKKDDDQLKLIMTMTTSGCETPSGMSESDMYLPHYEGWVSVVKLPGRNPQWSVPLAHVLNI